MNIMAYIKVFSVLCSIMSFKTLVFTRFKDPSLYSIDLTGCSILGEEHPLFCFALCSEAFSL